MYSQNLISCQLASSTRLNRRHFLKQVGALGTSSIALNTLLEACDSAPKVTTHTSPPVNLAGPIDMRALIINAKKEHELEAIGIPPQWANYLDTLQSFTEKYVPVYYQAEAEYSSTEELKIFTQSKQHPYGDVGDISFQFGPTAIEQGLVTPYKHSQWTDISNNLKDPRGNWCTEYWLTQAFVINTDIVKKPPTSFKELLSGDYKNMVGIDGDPREANDAFMTVYSAALAATGGLDTIQPGIDFFAQLKENGNFTTDRASILNIAEGKVAIAIIWDYLGLIFRDKLNSKPHLQVTIPSDGSLASPYICVINKTAPHPYAARLWVEYLFSDEGQLNFLKGYAHPARYQELVSAGKVPDDLAAKLPAAEQYANITFATNLSQLNKAATTIMNYWQSQVLGQ